MAKKKTKVGYNERMVPASARQNFTEEEYWRLLDSVRGDVEAATSRTTAITTDMYRASTSR